MLYLKSCVVVQGQAISHFDDAKEYLNTWTNLKACQSVLGVRAGRAEEEGLITLSTRFQRATTYCIDRGNLLVYQNQASKEESIREEHCIRSLQATSSISHILKNIFSTNNSVVVSDDMFMYLILRFC